MKVNCIDLVEKLNRISRFYKRIELMTTEEMLEIAQLELFNEPVGYKSEKKIKRLNFD